MRKHKWWWFRLLGPAGLLGLAIGTASAQSLIDPDRVWLERQVDSLERRSATDPAATAQEARELRRALDAQRAAAGDQAARETAPLERRLQRVIAKAQPTAPSRPTMTGAQGDLPASYDRDDSGWSSERDPAVTIELLLRRAREGLAEGRLAQARSDLSWAARELDTLRSGPNAELPASYDRQQRRLNELTTRVEATGR